MQRKYGVTCTFNVRMIIAIHSHLPVTAISSEGSIRVTRM